MTTYQVYKPPGQKILGMDYDKYIMVGLVEQITEEEHERLPEGLSLELWQVVVNGETDNLFFPSEWHLNDFYVQRDIDHISQRFGPKAQNSFDQYEDPHIWWEDYFDRKSENRNLFGIVNNPKEPIETEHAVINEVNEATLPLIHETYGLEAGNNNRSFEEEERQSLFLS